MKKKFDNVSSVGRRRCSFNELENFDKLFLERLSSVLCFYVNRYVIV